MPNDGVALRVLVAVGTESHDLPTVTAEAVILQADALVAQRNSAAEAQNDRPGLATEVAVGFFIDLDHRHLRLF